MPERTRGPGHSAAGRRPKVLVIAEAANPEWVSVPLVGWSIADALRSVADVHLVTQVRNRDAILRAGLVEERDFTAIDSEALARPVHRLTDRLVGKGKGWTARTAVASLTYPYFEHLVWKRFGARVTGRTWDIVHRVTPLSPTAPSPIARRCRAAGVPFVMGPLNGGIPWPPGFDAERRREREWLSYVRNAYKLLPGRQATLDAASAILVGSRHTASEIPERHRGKCHYVPENAVDPTRFGLRAADNPAGPLRVSFIGRLVPYKGPDMLIEALHPFLADGRCVLEVIGDGPMRGALEAMARSAGLGGAVTFHGSLPHRDVQTVAARCAVLGFPSVREFGGGVVLEAMALGSVPVVVDYGGPGELVTGETGFRVPIGTRAQIVDGVRDVFGRILSDRACLPPMGERARERVLSGFTWEKKAEQIRDIYDGLLEAV